MCSQGEPGGGAAAAGQAGHREGGAGHGGSGKLPAPRGPETHPESARPGDKLQLYSEESQGTVPGRGLYKETFDHRGKFMMYYLIKTATLPILTDGKLY